MAIISVLIPLVGSIVGLKGNSISTNFRDHGFRIVPSPADQLKSEFGITDTRHSTVFDAEQIRHAPNPQQSPMAKIPSSS
jgi:hypothetical protein